MTKMHALRIWQKWNLLVIFRLKILRNLELVVQTRPLVTRFAREF